jgi:hypothetical protein
MSKNEWMKIVIFSTSTLWVIVIHRPENIRSSIKGLTYFGRSRYLPQTNIFELLSKTTPRASYKTLMMEIHGMHSKNILDGTTYCRYCYNSPRLKSIHLMPQTNIFELLSKTTPRASYKTLMMEIHGMH